MKETFFNQFGRHANDYKKYRPTTPRDLCRWVAQNSPANDTLLDCGTGSGQAAVGLAEFFTRVHAADASAEQIEHAVQHPNVAYHVAPAESLPLGDGTVDAVTCATAFHWFDTEPFISEAKRVLRPGGLLAVWTYLRAEIDPEIESVVTTLAQDVLGDYWHPRVKQQRECYARPWPTFDEIETPEIAIEKTWTVDELLGYLRTWSAYRNYLREIGTEPMPELGDALKAVWGARPTRTIRWNLLLRAATV